MRSLYLGCLTVAESTKTAVNKNSLAIWPDDHVPYICWDRHWTVGEIRRRLADQATGEKFRVLAWLMRELKPSEVWLFTSPRVVYTQFDDIKPWLGRSRNFWAYILGTWHELGKI